MSIRRAFFMKWLKIGSVKRKSKHQEGILKLEDGYSKALTKLDLFSHCILFMRSNNRLEVYSVEIIHISLDRAEILFKVTMDNHEFKGELVDIKPYFSIEEVIEEAKEPAQRFCINYQGDSIGEYMRYGKRMGIQLNKTDTNIHHIQQGDYLRVLWWFDRFDGDNFRKIRTCMPPYNHAPRTGVFATRSPVRPNPIGSTLVRVNNVWHDDGFIEIIGFDGFIGSKILQVMFYQPSMDCIKSAGVPSWVSHWTKKKTFAQPKEVDARPMQTKVLKFKKLSMDLEQIPLDEHEEDSKNIQIHNAHIHNLKNLSVKIPKNKITLISGVSGSGKSSLAFDILYAESQRQFMDLILSNPMGDVALSDRYVDNITGLQPAIAINQRALGANPRSSVGSVTKIGDILKLIFSIIGQRICPICHHEIDAGNVCSSCGEVFFDRTPQLFSSNHPDYMCPVCKGLGMQMGVDSSKIVEAPEKSLLDGASSLYGNLRKHRENPNANWIRGEVLALAADLDVDLELAYNQLPERFKQEMLHGSNGRNVRLDYKNAKGRSGTIVRPVEGAIPLIERLMHSTSSSKTNAQVQRYMTKQICSECQGERLQPEGRLVHIMGDRYVKVIKLSSDELHTWCHHMYMHLPHNQQEQTKKLFVQLNRRLKRILDVGIGYLSIDRSIPSLSAGEAQRLKLASQLGSGLSNITYIMDEPSKGLHPKDYQFLMETLLELKRQDNTILIVEHKKSFLEIADVHLVMGPRAGVYGGEIVSNVPLEHRHPKTMSAEVKVIEDIKLYTKQEAAIQMKKVATYNLKNIDVTIPIGQLTAVIGVSGSGKSSLIAKTLYPAILKHMGKTVEASGEVEAVVGLEAYEQVCYVNQSPIGSNPRSTPGTYTGVFDLLRERYAGTQQAKAQGLTKASFSFNSTKGQCPKCKGLGEVAVNMHYMEDIYIPCSQCHGKRYADNILNIKEKGMSIADILDVEIQELLKIYEHDDRIFQYLLTLDQIGLGYLKLGQSATTLSGGEAQRIKLAKELVKKRGSQTLYILDEPTTGLSDEDTQKIIAVLKRLKSRGATLIIIEHNLMMIKNCDYLIELGPKGGDQGGELMRIGYIKK